MVITAGSIWLALQVAPLQTVSAAGQTAQVGAAVPDFSLSGPGELDLFGQVVPTKPQFTGPIRPLLKLTHITIDDEVARLLRSDSPRTLELNLSQQLAQGWTHYFEWETLIAAGFAVVALVAVAGIGRQPYKKMAKTVIAGLVVVIAVNVGGVLLTASSTPGVLRSVKTLDDLVGADPLTAPQQAATRPLPGVQAVVIGDSTAAAIGNPRLRNATPLDRACGRSSESYAADLAMVNNWNVLNLACSGATVQNGLLGAQVLGNGQVAPPQLAEAARATHAKVIIVSVGADDVQWSIMTRLCVASTVCNDKVSAAFFSQADRRLHPQLLRAARRPVRAARQPGRPGQPVLLAVRLGPELPGQVRHHRGQGEGPDGPPEPAQHGAGAGGPDVRLRCHRSPVHRARAVHRRPLRAGAGRSRAAAPDGRRRAGHRPGRPAGAAEGGGPGPGAVSDADPQRRAGMTSSR